MKYRAVQYCHKPQYCMDTTLSTRALEFGLWTPGKSTVMINAWLYST